MNNLSSQQSAEVNHQAYFASIASTQIDSSLKNEQAESSHLTSNQVIRPLKREDRNSPPMKKIRVAWESSKGGKSDMRFAFPGFNKIFPQKLNIRAA